MPQDLRATLQMEMLICWNLLQSKRLKNKKVLGSKNWTLANKRPTLQPLTSFCRKEGKPDWHVTQVFVLPVELSVFWAGCPSLDQGQWSLSEFAQSTPGRGNHPVCAEEKSCISQPLLPVQFSKDCLRYWSSLYISLRRGDFHLISNASWTYKWLFSPFPLQNSPQV